MCHAPTTVAPTAGVDWFLRIKELDVVGSCLSPGVRRMIGRVGAQEPCAQGGVDLEELADEGAQQAGGAGLRTVGGPGGSFRARETILTGKWTPRQSAAAILYMALDATGVPVVPRETAGRHGKDSRGKAQTRAAKSGCVFTQTQQDEGYPMRDEDSTTYVGAWRPPRLSVRASRRRPCGAACGRPRRWWCAEMGRPGCGEWPRNILPGPSRSWTYIMRVHIWRIWEKPCMVPL